MKEKLEKIEGKIDSMCSAVSAVDKQLAVNTRILEEHQRRSLALESEVRKLDSHFNKVLGAFILAQVLIPVILKFIV